MARLELTLLGGLETGRDDGRPFPLSARKARALLAYLAMQPGRSFARDTLAALLWEASGDAQARTSLRQALTAIRRAATPGLDDVLATTGDTVALRPALVACDALAFERATVADAAAAVALYRGDFLAGFHVGEGGFDDWASAERERLRELALGTLTRLLDAALGDADSQYAVELAQRVLRFDPLRESAHRALMRLYARQRRTAAALRQYRLLRETLRRELGVPPEPATEALHREIAADRRGRPDGATAAEAGTDTEPTPAPTPPAPTPPAPAPPAPMLRQAAVLAVERMQPQSGDLEAAHAGRLRLEAQLAAVAAEHGGFALPGGGGRSLLLFGADVTRGDDVDRALAAAAALAGRTDPGGPSLRFGLACGPLLASGTGAHFAVTGEALLLAPHLAGLARPGEIVLDDAVRRTVRHKLQAVRLAGTRDPAGRPAAAWRLERMLPGVPRHDRPLVARRAEMRQFEGLLEDCREQGAGTAVLLSGDAGIGKSRLAQEFSRLAAARGFSCHTALVLDFGTGIGRDPPRALVRSLLGLVPDARGRARREAAADAAASGLVAPADLAALGDLLNLEPPAELRSRWEAAGEAERVAAKRQVLGGLIRRRAAERPLLLTVEDIHWLDAAGLAFLAVVAATTQDSPTLLLLTGRPKAESLDRAWQAMAGDPPLVTMTLRPLRPSEALDLATAVAGGVDRRVGRCVERAGGNPLFLEQLLESPQVGDGAAVPETVQALVLARLDALPPADAAAARAAAVLGQYVDPAALARLLDLPAYDPAPLLHAALLRPEGGGCRFVHAVVRDAVHAGMLPSERRRLHAAAARHYAGLDVELEAEHLAAADDPAAAAAFLRAARAHAGAWRFGRALQLIERGLEGPLDGPGRYALLARRGELLVELGRPREALAALREALGTAADAVGRRRVLVGRAEALRLLDRYDEALAALDAAAAEPAPADLRTGARIATLRGALHFPRGDIARCVAAHEEGLALARRSGSPRIEAQALSGLADAAYVEGRMASAHRRFDDCLAVARAHGLAGVEAPNLAMRAATGFFLLELRQALEDAGAALQLAEEIGQPRARLLALNVLVGLLLHRTDWPEAARHAGEAIGIARRIGARRFESEALALLAFALRAAGLPGGEDSRFAEAYAQAQEVGAGYAGPQILGLWAVATGARERRRWALAEGERLLAAGAVSHNHLHFRQLAIEAAAADGDLPAVVRHTDALAAFAAAEPLPFAELAVRRGRALAAGDEAALAAATAEAARLGLCLPSPTGGRAA